MGTPDSKRVSPPDDQSVVICCVYHWTLVDRKRFTAFTRVEDGRNVCSLKLGEYNAQVSSRGIVMHERNAHESFGYPGFKKSRVPDDQF